MSEGEPLLRQEDLDALFQTAAGSPEANATPTPAAPMEPEQTISRPGASLGSRSQQSPNPAGSARSSPPVVGLETDDTGRLLRQAEIDKLLEQAGASRPKKSPPTTKATPPPPPEDSQSPKDIEYLLEQAEKALRSVEEPTAISELPPGVRPFQFEQFGSPSSSAEAATLDLVSEVELEVRIELGQARMHLEDVLKLRKGSVVTLDKLAGDPVDIYVNGRLIARGEVLVLNDNFCVRVIELVAPK